jgi:hydrogenase maturation protein HypF
MSRLRRAAAPARPAPERQRVEIEGVVQGVGFRPYVYRLAAELGVAGFVRNTGRGVLLELEGEGERVREVIARLAREAPPLARVERIRSTAIAPVGARAFVIGASTPAPAADAPVMADTATCAACLAELFDPGNRRFRYAFIACTGCGPRFTIVRATPYDRVRTTMRRFAMCARCRAEYEDPSDRRFHAEPNACPACGPTLRLVDARGGSGATADPIGAAAAALRGGQIVAIKGIGGFHLACRADEDGAVATLRARKRRDAKPFALMVADLAAARALAAIGDAEAGLLSGAERPIVLVRRRPGAAVANGVAPGLEQLGLMLPYTPLHHLLLTDVAVPLVMTSGNRGDEPIAYRNRDALRRLGDIADWVLLHDRPIQARSDDSVVRVVGDGVGRGPLLLRRARGYVPASLALPFDAPPLLACGADLKNAFCIASGRRAWVGPHAGDLHEYAAQQAYARSIAHCERLFGITPEVVAHDLHPDYRSTAYARGRAGVRHVAVQHHHAHFAACLAEHGERGQAVGAIFDGTGYGTDGTIWGGEFLVGDIRSCVRAAHLWPVRLPGGDRAVREPWRMACAWLIAAGDREPDVPASLAPRVDPQRWAAVAALVRSGVSAPWTSSIGRLFDAISALCGLCAEARYEGEAAILLEAHAGDRADREYPMPLVDGRDHPAGGVGARVLDAREAIRAVLRDLCDGVPVSVISARFHDALARAAVETCAGIARAHGLETVVFSGGVFQNRRLLERVVVRARAYGLRVLRPYQLPPNDGGIGYGQAAVAAAQCRGPASDGGR